MKKVCYPLFVLLLLFTLNTNAQTLLDPKSQPQFVNPLPIPSVIDARSGGSFTISISQFEQHLGLIHPVTKQPLLTKVWGYNGTYPGPTFVVKKNIPINVKWENNLKNSSGLLPHLLPIDPTIHWALKDRVTGEHWEYPLLRIYMVVIPNQPVMVYRSNGILLILL
jgi:spore coat protein A, manganese oxidase